VCEKSITNSQPFVKKMKKMSGPLGGIFFYSHCILSCSEAFMRVTDVCLTTV